MLKKIVIIVCIIVFLILVVLGAGIFWGLSKVNSPEVKQLITAKINESTGLNVEIEKLHIGLFSTEINNLNIPAGKGAANGENFLHADSAIVHYNILQLLRSPITVSKIEVNNTTVIARQDSAGNLLLPIEKAPGTATQTAATPGKPLQLSLPEIYLRNTTVSLYAHDKSLLFGAQDANLQASFAMQGENQQANGTLKIKKTTFTPGLSVNDLNIPFTYANNDLTVSKFQGAIYGGTLGGDANLKLGNKPSTFNTNFNIAKADLSGMLADLGSDPNSISGKFDLNFEGNGNLDEPKNLNGKGNLLIPSPVIGKLKTYQNLTNLIGTVGGISALKEGKFDNIKSDFTISGQKLQLNPLEVNSQNISITLGGPLGFDKSLDLKGEINLAPGIFQVAQTVENIIGAVNAIKNPDKQPANSQVKTPDKVKLPLAISGNTDDPKLSVDTSPLSSLVNGGNSAPQGTQEKTQSLINTLGDLFNKKKKTEEPAPATETQPTPPSENDPAQQ